LTLKRVQNSVAQKGEMNLRKIMTIITALTMLFVFSVQIYASTGDPNIDNGGGGMGGGTTSNFWNPGNDGVRITVIDAKSGAEKSKSVDYSNKTNLPIKAHFEKISKIKYRNGESLSAKSTIYDCYSPGQPIPTIIYDGEGNMTNIDTIRSYFTDEGVVKRIAIDTGIKFDKLTNGDCKLLIEPLAYFTYNGVFMAMTATEAALLDVQGGGDLRSKMAPLTHKNLPLAMFLEKNDANFKAWNGSTTSKATNSDIINYLGIGIVTFTDTPTEEVDIDFPDYTYRTNTDVITSVTVSSGEEHNPDNPITVKFRIGGVTYSVGNVVFPAGSSQLVWVKWHTPKTPQDINIYVDIIGGASVSNGIINAQIVELSENPPPDPKATDLKPNNWHIENTPNRSVQKNASWSVWWAKWHEYWVWHPRWVWKSTGNGDGYWVDRGKWVDEGWWDFFIDNYNAKINVEMTIIPDEKSPTASGKTMKSGYGFTEKATANVKSNANSVNYTTAQNVMTYFPEFYYKTYWRILEKMSENFVFKENKFSTYNSRVHFTPLWFPDGEYKAYSYIFDAWTPSGMLSVSATDSLNISGNVYDDWLVVKSN
jgi:hypothetical protein